jgi:hypothetical protein
MSFTAASSSVARRVFDTVRTIEAMVDAMVVRHGARRRTGLRRGSTPPSSTPVTVATSTRPRRRSTCSRCDATSGRTRLGSGSASSATPLAVARSAKASAPSAPTSRYRPPTLSRIAEGWPARAHRPGRRVSELDVVYLLAPTSAQLRLPSREYTSRYGLTAAPPLSLTRSSCMPAR